MCNRYRMTARRFALLERFGIEGEAEMDEAGCRRPNCSRSARRWWCGRRRGDGCSISCAGAFHRLRGPAPR